MYKYVAIKEKDKDWFFIGDEVGFGAGNEIQKVHRQYFSPIYKELFDSKKDIEFKYFKEKALNYKDFDKLEKTLILNNESIKIDDLILNLKEVKNITYHPNERSRHDPVDIGFLDEDGEVMYVFPDRTISNYLIFHDLIDRHIMINNNKYKDKLESIKSK